MDIFDDVISTQQGDGEHLEYYAGEKKALSWSIVLNESFIQCLLVNRNLDGYVYFGTDKPNLKLQVRKSIIVVMSNVFMTTVVVTQHRSTKQVADLPKRVATVDSSPVPGFETFFG